MLSAPGQDDAKDQDNHDPRIRHSAQRVAIGGRSVGRSVHHCRQRHTASSEDLAWPLTSASCRLMAGVGRTIVAHLYLSQILSLRLE